ncbi:SUN domain-containing protein 3, partial [Tinamus guttatus]
SGAAIIHSKTSASFFNTKGILFWSGLPLLHFMKSPDVILETENQPGNCWSFSGSQGHVFIKLSKAISPHAVTLEHIAVRVSPRGDISSAPKDFAVYGMKAENEEQGLFLGEFTYSPAEHPFQTFWLQNEGWDSVRYVKLEVLSNWGHPEYTCLYRVRVHG